MEVKGVGVGEGEFERNFSSWLVTHLLTTGGRLSLPPMQMGEAEAQGRPLEIGGVSSGLFPIWGNQSLVRCLEIQSSTLSGSQSGVLWSSGHRMVSHLVSTSTNHGLWGPEGAGMWGG